MACARCGSRPLQSISRSLSVSCENSFTTVGRHTDSGASLRSAQCLSEGI